MLERTNDLLRKTFSDPIDLAISLRRRAKVEFQ